MKQYSPERSGSGTIKGDRGVATNEDGIGGGRASTNDLHGKHTLQNKIQADSRKVNEVDAEGDIALKVRTTQPLDYIGLGETNERYEEFMRKNDDMIDLEEPDDLYPSMSGSQKDG